MILAAAYRISTRRLCQPATTRLLLRTAHLSTTASVRSDLTRVRNLGIIAHIDAGKTTTTERMLHYAGFTRSIGDVDDGDTVMDYLPAERERGITIQSAAITFGWRDHQLHLIDTPGHVDFTVEVERAMRVLDGAVTIIDSVAGVQAQTQTVWTQAKRYGIPCLVFINKMDRDGANWKKCFQEVHTKLGTRPLLLMLPESSKHWIRLEGKQLENWLDVVNMELVSFDISADNTGSTVSRRKLSLDQDPEAWEIASHWRIQLVEALAEMDQQIVDVFLSDQVDGDHLKVPSEDIKQAIRRVTLASDACPVLMGASFRNIGVQPLLDAIIDYLPSPKDRPLPLATSTSKSQKETTVAINPQDKLVAFAFKVIVDQQRGPMVFVRVYSGTLDSRMTLINGTQGGIKERALKLLQMYANVPEEINSIECGHIGVILGLKQTKTGDTLMHPSHPALSKSALKNAKKSKPSAIHALIESNPIVSPVGLQLHGIEIPPPVFFCAVEADSPQDEKPLAETLVNLTLEDPSLHVSQDKETGQTLLSGMGELHLEVVRDRMLKDLKINASFGDMRVSYREMPSQLVSTHYVYAKEITGKVYKASMNVQIEPIEHIMEGSELTEKIDDGNQIDIQMPQALEIPDGSITDIITKGTEPYEAIHEAIENGINNALYCGSLLGFPLARSKITITNVAYFGSELSTPTAYRLCATQALLQLFPSSQPVLLEPLAKATILCPESFIGGVLSDLNGLRRGRVVSLDNSDMENLDSTNLTKVLVAQVPLSTMIGYSSKLRSLTAGSGTFTMEVIGFDTMSAQQQQQVVKGSRGY